MTINDDRRFTITDDLARRIHTLERELEMLRRQQLADFLRVIQSTIGPNIAFSSQELWRHRDVNPALEEACRALQIHSPRQLGKRLQRLAGQGLARVGTDRDGVVWVVEVPNDHHQGDCRFPPGGV